MAAGRIEVVPAGAASWEEIQAGSGRGARLVAYLDGEPAGWCAVEPRAAYPRLPRNVRF